MLRAGHVIGLAAFALLCLGVVMVQSALMSVGAGAVTVDRILLSKSAAFLAAAAIAMVVASRLPVASILDARRMGPPRWRLGSPVHPLLLLASGALLGLLLLVYVPGLGREVNGSRRWVHLPGGQQFQPSEVAKWGVLLVLAGYCAWQGAERMRSFWRLLPGLGLAGALAALVIKEDLGTGALMLAASAIILAAGGGRIWQMLILAPPAVAGIVYAILSSPYRKERILAFLDPYQNPETTGYHMIQSMVAIAHGEGWGRGLGFGLQKFGYLPEDETDFLFAIICEELGIAGASVVVALYLAILWAGLAIVRRAPHGAPKLLGIGVLATFGLQAVINLAVVTCLAPTKGIALPLLSSGGTGWVLTAASLGVLMAMDRAYPDTAPSRGLAATSPPLATAPS